MCVILEAAVFSRERRLVLFGATGPCEHGGTTLEEGALLEAKGLNALVVIFVCLFVFVAVTILRGRVAVVAAAVDWVVVAAWIVPTLGEAILEDGLPVRCCVQGLLVARAVAGAAVCHVE